MHKNVIDRYWYSIDWDVTRIWALELPVHEVPIDRLLWHMDVPVWSDTNEVPYSVTPNQVLQSTEENKREYDRILSADLSYPIDVYQMNRRLMILDGIHRLARTKLLGRDVISVRFVPEDAVTKL